MPVDRKKMGIPFPWLRPSVLINFVERISTNICFTLVYVINADIDNFVTQNRFIPSFIWSNALIYTQR
jgi:hypothetical protein